MGNGNEQVDVVVVGAGLSGLSCAFELTRKGKKVLVLEAHPYAGGRTASFVDHGMKVESGLHRYIGYYSALPSLVKKCGVPIGEIVTWEEKADVLLKGENRKLVLGVAPFFGFRKAMRSVLGNRDILSARDKLSLMPFFLCGFASFLSSQKLDQYSVAEYANRHHVTEKAKRLVLEPLSSGIFFLPPENYSAYAFFGLFAPAIPKFYKMRIGAYLGGMTEMMCNPIVRTVQAQGGRFCFGEPVEQVLVQKGAVVGVRGRSGQEYRAAQTVIATTLPAAKKILVPLKNRTELQSFFQLPTMSSCSIQLELDRPALKKDITTFAPGTDMVSFAEQSRSTFRDSKGRLSVILGNPDEYADKEIQEILPVVLEQMDSLGVHLKGHVLDARKVAEKNDFYSLGKGSQHLRPRQETGIRGLTLAGDYTLTSSFATMEGAVLSGKKAAKSCLNRIAGK
ncbi:MAG: FAD-dependent oxidoreductase [Clostridiales bacterium]|nr:FAD-dependent oxidoreductase [Clostridiales bacterium]